MSLSVHQVFETPFDQLLESLSAILDKAESHCKETGASPDDMLAMRLAPDMFTLKEQVQRACMHTRGAAARLARIDVPESADDEQTFEDLRNTIAQTRAFVAGLAPAQLNDGETATIEQPTRIGTFTYEGSNYLLCFALPQFMFHVTTAYDIIRHAGVTIGKADYMGSALRQ